MEFITKICGLIATVLPQLVWKCENKTLIYAILKISVPNVQLFYDHLLLSA
jgi:hypothetical protein